MIYVVTGPPCGGKSTYIKKHAKTGDIVIDMDNLARALTTEDIGNHDYSQEVRYVAMMARKAAVKEAMFQCSARRGLDAWIIHTDPSPDERRQYRLHNSNIVECNPGKDVCLERLKERPAKNQELAKRVIDAYFARR